MAKVRRTVSLDAELWERVEEWTAENEAGTVNAAVGLLVKSALDGSDEAARSVEQSGVLVAELQDRIEDLKRQLDVKDGQIEAANRLADQAQRLHLAAETKHETDETRGFWSRLFGNQ